MPMTERKEPRFIEFKEGDSVQGVLIAIQRVNVTDRETGERRKVMKYVLDEGTLENGKFARSGESVAFLGSYQLNTLFRLGDKGHLVTVRFEGLDKEKGRNGNAMKKFRVWVSDEIVAGASESASDETEITDDDIPF